VLGFPDQRRVQKCSPVEAVNFEVGIVQNPSNDFERFLGFAGDRRGEESVVCRALGMTVKIWKSWRVEGLVELIVNVLSSQISGPRYAG